MNRFLSTMSITLAAVLLVAANVSIGDPIPGLDVSLEQVPGGPTARTKTDGDGKFFFNNLAAGTYTLRVTCKTYKPSPEGAETKTSMHSATRSQAGISMKISEDSSYPNTEASAAAEDALYEYVIAVDGSRQGKLTARVRSTTEKAMAYDSWTKTLTVTVASCPNGRCRLSGYVAREAVVGSG